MAKLLSTLAGLLSLVSLGWAQKPSNAGTEALIEKGRQTTLAYSASLPDFVCTEVVSRYRTGAGARTSAGSWIPLDKLTVKLSYFQQQETHQLLLVNGIPTGLTYNSLDAGAITSGEFGHPEKHLRPGPRMPRCRLRSRRSRSTERSVPLQLHILCR